MEGMKEGFKKRIAIVESTARIWRGDNSRKAKDKFIFCLYPFYRFHPCE